MRELKLPATPRHAALPPLDGCKPFHDSLSPLIATPLVKASLHDHIDQDRHGLTVIVH
jgi:hypothetical protein